MLQILTFLFTMEIGLCPVASFQLYEPKEFISTDWPLYADLIGEIVLLEHFFIGGGMKSVFFKTGGSGFSTFSIDYLFFTGFRIGDSFEIGFRHKCIHPALTYITPADLSGRNLEGAYEEIYIKFRGKINIF